jgi:DNA-binding transcriptional ArsR family regulator
MALRPACGPVKMTRVNDSVNTPDVQLNAVGDVILNDARQLTALADPGRLSGFEWLQRHGPATIDEVGAALGTTPEAAAASLAVLEGAGLVHQAGEAWEAHGRGLFLQLPDDDPEAVAAARALSNVMLLAVEDLPRRWVADAEPRLEAEWAGAAGLFNANPVVTADELARIQEELEDLLEPFLNRSPSDAPADARKVRLLAYFLPSVKADDVVPT